MSINENELLELNADLMVLIREKQEQGELADAISLQIVLHKNLMRLRQFMAAPDKPIPDAPKDWMPPMPRPDTPPGGSDSEGDSADEQSSNGERSARKGKGKGKGKVKLRQQQPAQRQRNATSTSSGGATGAVGTVTLPGFTGFGGASDGSEEKRGGGGDQPRPDTPPATTSTLLSTSSTRRKQRPRKKKGQVGGSSSGNSDVGSLLYAGMLAGEQTASHIPSSVPFMPKPPQHRSSENIGASGGDGGVSVTSGAAGAAASNPAATPLATPSSPVAPMIPVDPVANSTVQPRPLGPPKPAPALAPAPAVKKGSAAKRLGRPSMAPASQRGTFHGGQGGAAPAPLAPAPPRGVGVGGFGSPPYASPFFPSPYGVSPFAGAPFAGGSPMGIPLPVAPSPFGVPPFGAPPFGVFPFVPPHGLPLRPVTVGGAAMATAAATVGAGVGAGGGVEATVKTKQGKGRRRSKGQTIDAETAAEIRKLRTVTLLANIRHKSTEDEDVVVDVEGDSDDDLGVGQQGTEEDRLFASLRDATARGAAVQVERILGATQVGGGIASQATPPGPSSTTAVASLLDGDKTNSVDDDDDHDGDDPDFSFSAPSVPRREKGSATDGGVEETKGERQGGRTEGNPERPILAQSWMAVPVSVLADAPRTSALDPSAVSNFGFDDEEGSGA